MFEGLVVDSEPQMKIGIIQVLRLLFRVKSVQEKYLSY